MDNAVDGGILLLIGWERMKHLKARPGVFMIRQIVIPGKAIDRKSFVRTQGYC